MKREINYQNSKIYMIIGKKTNKIYIGSTTYSLEHRLEGHKDDYKKWFQGNTKYVSSYKILRTGDSQIILLEKYPCQTKKELHKRETQWILQYAYCCVNMVLPMAINKIKTRRHIYKEHQNKYYIFQKSTSVKFIDSIEFLDD